VILTFGEDGLYGHPDHAAAAEIAHRAAAALGDPEVLESVWLPSTARALAAAARAEGLPDSLWGLDAEAFGIERELALSVDVRPVLAQKLAALHAHRTQLDPAHLMTALPLELAERHLAREHWAGPSAVRLRELLDRG
jgi:N-acetyl-1-D-myo-inositol-2-amino-2-deoxy-alpha-D-glucopyranoside deacetylase